MLKKIGNIYIKEINNFLENKYKINNLKCLVQMMFICENEENKQ